MRNRFGKFLILLLASIGGGAPAAATFTDAAGRKIELPAKIERVYAAGSRRRTLYHFPTTRFPT